MSLEYGFKDIFNYYVILLVLLAFGFFVLFVFVYFVRKSSLKLDISFIVSSKHSEED